MGASDREEGVVPLMIFEREGGGSGTFDDIGMIQPGQQLHLQFKLIDSDLVSRLLVLQ